MRTRARRGTCHPGDLRRPFLCGRVPRKGNVNCRAFGHAGDIILTPRPSNGVKKCGEVTRSAAFRQNPNRLNSSYLAAGYLSNTSPAPHLRSTQGSPQFFHMNSPPPAGRRNSIVEKVSIAKRRLSLESSDAVNDTLRKKFAHWTAPSTDGRRLSVDARSDASISSQNSEGTPPLPSSPYLAPANSYVFLNPDANYIPAAEIPSIPLQTPVAQPLSCGLEANQLTVPQPMYDFLGPPRQESPSLRSKRSGVVRSKTSSGNALPLAPEAAPADGLLTSNERMLFQPPVMMRFSGGALPVAAGTAVDPFADFSWAETGTPAPQN